MMAGGEIRVVACVARRGDRMLICQRPAHKRHGGLWEFPGGKCERGESDAAAAERELREELGVILSEIGAPVFSRRDEESPFLIVFVPVEFRGEPTCLEHAALAWADSGEILEYALAPSDRAFAEFVAGRVGR